MPKTQYMAMYKTRGQFKISEPNGHEFFGGEVYTKASEDQVYPFLQTDEDHLAAILDGRYGYRKPKPYLLINIDDSNYYIADFVGFKVWEEPT